MHDNAKIIEEQCRKFQDSARRRGIGMQGNASSLVCTRNGHVQVVKNLSIKLIRPTPLKMLTSPIRFFCSVVTEVNSYSKRPLIRWGLNRLKVSTLKKPCRFISFSTHHLACWTIPLKERVNRDRKICTWECIIESNITSA
jgi:hypothetical protein